MLMSIVNVNLRADKQVMQLHLVDLYHKNGSALPTEHQDSIGNKYYKFADGTEISYGANQLLLDSLNA